MGISGKLVAGFLAVAAVTLGVGFVGWYGIRSNSDTIVTLGKESIPAIQDMEIVKVNKLQVQVVLRTLTSLYLTDQDYKTQLGKVDSARAASAAASKDYTQTAKTPEEARLYKAFLDADAVSHTNNDRFLALYKQLRQSSAKPEDVSRRMTELENSGETSVAFEKMMSALQAHLDYIKLYYGKTLVERAGSSSSFLNALMIAIAAAGVAAALLLGLVLSRSISRPVARVTRELREAAKSLESASLQVSSSSQELSSGSSELASSLEEMTSSLEELQSIIEGNTRSVGQGELLMRETADESHKVTDRMGELKTQLGDIAGNSRKISKIIKAIDDIAFQTNILALNAAVEAARAGDEGKGLP